MKIENFEDYLNSYFLLSPDHRTDILMAYREYFQKEVNERVQEQLIMMKEQVAAELESTIRNETQQEEIRRCISELRSEKDFLMSLTKKLMFSPTTKSSVELHNTMNLPAYDRLWISIRKWQRATGISNSEIARMLGLSERTLHSYDKSARTMTLEKLTNFLSRINGSIEFRF